MSQHHRSGLWTRRDSELWRKRLAPGVQHKACTKCGYEIGDALWDVDHIYGLAEYPELAKDPSNLGPAHRSCNRSSGGKEGRAKQIKKTQQDKRMPEW